MADRPIIFSAPMVRALLGGRKTQTRRKFELPANSGRMKLSATPNIRECKWQRGDRLWVREAWRVGAWDYENSRMALDYCDGPRQEWLTGCDSVLFEKLVGQSKIDGAAYEASNDAGCSVFHWKPGSSPCRWRSPIHMPRWASRLTLTVTDVRVQEISAKDVTAEGIPFESDALAPYEWSVSRFADLWNSIHGPGAWDQNPWVAAISFETRRCNIDTMEEGTW